MLLQGLQALAAQLPTVAATVLQPLGELSLRKACLQVLVRLAGMTWNR